MSHSLKSKILIAEDDAAILELVRIRLEVAGFQTYFARDGHEAMQAALRIKPHAMVLDVGLPHANGFKVLEYVKSCATLKNIPVLMLTARHMEADVQRSLSLGAQDFVTKPFDDRKLVERVERLLSRRPPATGLPETGTFV